MDLSAALDKLPEDVSYVVAIRREGVWEVSWSRGKKRVEGRNWVEFKINCKQMGWDWKCCEWIRS